MGKSLVASVLVIAATAALLYLAVVAWLWWKQESLLFFPTPLAPTERIAVDADVHELAVAVDGAQLSVLHLRLPEPKGVVLYLHGNAGNLVGWFTHAQLYRDANLDLVMPDYRGYGKSTGRITSEAQMRDDVRAVWQHVAGRYAGKRVVVLGRSLGTALAAQFAAERSAQGQPPALTVLVSPYSSIRQMMRELYPWIPTAVLRYPLDTERHVAAVRGGLLLVHGERDELIGVHHARRLQQAVPHAQLHVIPGAGHNDLQEFGAYRELLLRELGSL